MNLDNVSIFKPVAGKTLREQLQGKTLAGADVIEYLRSFHGDKAKDFVPPAHWDKPGTVPKNSGNIYLFSLTHVIPARNPVAQGHAGAVQGVCWATDGFHIGHCRSFFRRNVLDEVVGENWYAGDWILVANE